MRTALENRILNIRPYEYTNIVKLQMEKLPALNSLFLRKDVDTIHYGENNIYIPEGKCAFVAENIPVGPYFKKYSLFSYSLYDCIEKKIILPLVLYGDKISYINYIIFEQDVEIIYNGLYFYMILPFNKSDIKGDYFYYSYPAEYKNNHTPNSDGILSSDENYTVNNINAEFSNGKCSFIVPSLGLNSGRLINKNFLLIFYDNTNKKFLNINYSDAKINRSSLLSYSIDISECLQNYSIADGTNLEIKLYAIQYIMKEETYYTNYEKVLKCTSDTINGIDNTIRSNCSESDIAILNSGLNISKDKTSEQAILEIANYDISLLNNLFKDSNYEFEVLSLSGSDISSSLNKDTHRISIPIRNKSNTELTSVLLFKNNKLYSKYSTIEYGKSYATFVFDEDYSCDNYEVVYIHGIHNYPDKTAVVGDNITAASESMYEFFEYNPSNTYFPITPSETYQIKQNVALNKIDKTTYSISSDSLKAGTKLIASYKDKYRYVSYTILEECINISLPSDFKFCQNDNQYMIFINGIKIGSDDFIIVKPSNELPFYELAVFSKIVLNPNDIVDIFYLPEIDHTSLSDVGENSEITFPFKKSDSCQSFSNDNTLVFIDGLKIRKEDLLNLANDTMIIKSNYSSKENVEAYYIKDLSSELSINPSSTEISSVGKLILAKFPNKLIKGKYTIPSNIILEKKEKITDSSYSVKNSCINYSDMSIDINNMTYVISLSAKAVSTTSYELRVILKNSRLNTISYCSLKDFIPDEVCQIISSGENIGVIYSTKSAINLSWITVTEKSISASSPIEILKESGYNNQTCRFHIIGRKYILLVNVTNYVAYVRIIYTNDGSAQYTTMYSKYIISAIQDITNTDEVYYISLKTRDLKSVLLLIKSNITDGKGV